ncbi:hypothetical protein HY635_00085 [Candidatus Uhrbacteria bacterium]|nr:hypothetical protein [Candidatus Uhrbacteria bacterium]
MVYGSGCSRIEHTAARRIRARYPSHTLDDGPNDGLPFAQIDGWRFVMSGTFTTGQIARLYEIERARLRGGGVGLHDEVQGLIRRLESGGVSPGAPQPHGGKRRGKDAKLPPRDRRILTQVKVLWDKGWATKMLDEDGKPRYRTFADYLASIPDLPTFPDTYDVRFPHLVLVDQRVQVVEACQMLGVQFSGDNSTFVPYDTTKSITALVYWIRIQDGKLHRGHKPSVCRTEFAQHGDEVGLEAHEGLALYAQSPDLLEINTAMDLTGSVHADNRGFSAFLERWAGDDMRLDWRWCDDPCPVFGSASRGDCVS